MIGDLDKEYWAKDRTVIGFDEAGRGPIAGDMIFSLVELFPIQTFPFQLKDSKKYSDNKRFKIEDDILNNNLVKSKVIGRVSVDKINSGENLNTLLNCAVVESMIQLLNESNINNPILFVDGSNPIKGLEWMPQFVQPKLDENSWSCAIASIYAKNTQVNNMIELDSKYPDYGFAKHKGYGTKTHYEAIKKCGICPEHRKNWIK